MQRVSSNTESMNFSYYNRLHEGNKNKLSTQMQSQQRIALLRDDPTAAAQSVRLQSKDTRLAQYENNLNQTINQLAVVGGNMTQATELLQRVREIAVQAANGTYAKDDMKYMATEINQYLEEMVQLANQKGADGRSLFAGTRTDTAAFRAVEGHVEGADSLVVTAVEYLGNNESRSVQYADGSQVQTQFTGNQVFWAENQQIWGANRVDGFVVPEDTAIVVDNQRIELRAGDSIHSVIQRINQADVAVKAELDAVENVLILKSTTPHQVWVADVPGSTIMADLGIVKTQDQVAPGNINTQARVSGGSMFDMIIGLRDALYSGDQMRVGGAALAGIDQAMHNINTQQATLGARQNRLEMAVQRTTYESLAYKTWDDQLRGLDFAQAATEMAAMDTTLQATYRMTSNLFKNSLMDFLR
jgi:flagellar hook-associated protein 3 FlgL